jgi:mannose-6-phosphate isomerase
VFSVRKILPLRGQIQEYPWGSRTVLAELLAQPTPSPRPQAELWLGAHPRASSLVESEGGWVPLSSVIAAQPEDVLGPRVAQRFAGRLPFLLKLIAAETPLSIQAHPDGDQAREGYARENALGIPLDAPDRSYKDPNPKPELLCATSPFTALCGFRPAHDLRARLGALNCPTLAEVLVSFLASPSQDTWRAAFSKLLSFSGNRRRRLIAEAAKAMQESGGVEGRWVLSLRETFGDDVGILAPLFLNFVQLEPGEAIFLGPGEPHAYLGGVAVELMSNSDNVLRGGLTPKYVDVPELLRTLTFAMAPLKILRGDPVSTVQTTYLTPTPEFQLSAIHLQSGVFFESEDERNVEILFCYDGSARIAQGDGGEVRVQRGTAWLVPAAAPRYRIEGTAALYRATVPSAERGVGHVWG